MMDATVPGQRDHHAAEQSVGRFLAPFVHRAPKFLYFLLLELAALPIYAQQATVLHDATLIDGTGAGPREHVDVILRQGLIEDIVPSSSNKRANERVIDCTGKTIIPGLISAHSHIGVLQSNAENSAATYNQPNVVAGLNQFERYGVTTTVSLGMNRDLVYSLRDQQRAGALGGATILTAGRGIGVANGAPAQPAAPDQVDRPTTPEEARQDVDAFAAHHADIVKMWLDPMHGKVPEMNTGIYTAVIDQSHKDRLPVAAHIYALDDALQLVNDGLDVLAHSVRDRTVDESFIQSVLQHHTWYIPTLALDESFYIYATEPQIMRGRFFREAAGPELLAKLEAPDYATKVLADPDTKQHQQDERVARQNLKILYDAGVRIASGTDSGASPGRIPGFSEHRELEDLVAAGLTPLQAITDATGSTGELIHMLNPAINVGLVAPGYSADLLILAGNPLADIKNTRKITAIYHRGRLVPNPAPQD
jgi:imidazolonepropionase-like amidohydrolase